MTDREIQPVSADSNEIDPAQPQSTMVAILYTLMSIILGSQTTIRSAPVRILYMAALGAPFVLVTGTYLRRRFFSVTLPVRWPHGSRTQRRLSRLSVAMLGVALLCWMVSFLVRLSFGAHDPRVILLHDSFWFLLAWMYVLLTYITDRKAIPPPRLRQPWREDMKANQSDHWGEAARH